MEKFEKKRDDKMITKILALGMFLFVAGVNASAAGAREPLDDVFKKAEEGPAAARETRQTDLARLMGLSRSSHLPQRFHGDGHPAVRKAAVCRRLYMKMEKRRLKSPVKDPKADPKNSKGLSEQSKSDAK